MTDQGVRDLLERMVAEGPMPFFDTEPLVRRARRRAARTVIVGALGVAAAIAVVSTGASQLRTAPVPADPGPAPSIMREDGEVLRFTGVTDPTVPDGTLGSPGDLVAVDPRTGDERVLLEDLDAVYSAKWSADGRWVAYEADAPDGVNRALWVVGGGQAPRVVATGPNTKGNPDQPWGELAWKWSPTGAKLATIERSETLRVIHVATGETTDLGGVVADLMEPAAIAAAWAWSPDGARFVFSAAGIRDDLNHQLYSVDVQSGERSLLARLPDEELPTAIRKIAWSPDGASIAVGTNGGDHVGRLYVLGADGSDVRLVADDSNSLGFAWSPDGTRLAFGSEVGRNVRLRIATMDGAAAAEVGTVGFDRCLRTSWGGPYECSVAWSPDGAQVAIRLAEAFDGETDKAIVFDAAGTGDGHTLDELTFISWDGGWYQSHV